MGFLAGGFLITVQRWITVSMLALKDCAPLPGGLTFLSRQESKQRNDQERGTSIFPFVPCSFLLPRASEKVAVLSLGTHSRTASRSRFLVPYRLSVAVASVFSPYSHAGGEIWYKSTLLPVLLSAYLSVAFLWSFPRAGSYFPTLWARKIVFTLYGRLFALYMETCLYFMQSIDFLRSNHHWSAKMALSIC